jgi:hypothetical protein
MDADILPQLSIVERDGDTQVFVEVPDPTDSNYEVLQNGKPLSVGHNRVSM